MLSFRKYILHLVVFLSIFADNFPQTTPDKNNFLYQNFILSLESGFSYGFTDYKTSNLEPLIRGSIEYYPIVINNARLGLKIFGGGNRISLSDNRGLLLNNDMPNPRQVPTDIYTDMIQIGGSINLGYALNESIITYLGMGAAYLNFSPKNSNGKILEFNGKHKYDKDIISFVIEGGVKYRISDRFSLNAAVSYYPATTDYLDDISVSKSNDSFLLGLIGISYAFTGRFDSDGDRIDNQLDLCPDTPEDFDEFEDEDGCPDIDNDGDGILDVNDKCPNDAEDFDGFQDEDGCPDMDNDGDGILDTNDKCPNDAEDFDGFKDEDGCPDLDNDSDGISDVKDKCPDQPETFNKFEDDDGCPDTVPASQETFYQFILRGDDAFASNSSTLNDAAKLLLNEIAFYIQNQPEAKWRIEGHMDSQGSVSLIKKLSYDRAKSVFEYLVSQGLSPSQFTIYGLGDSFPIANNNTVEGRSTNRRIMIIRED